MRKRVRFIGDQREERPGQRSTFLDELIGWVGEVEGQPDSRTVDVATVSRKVRMPPESWEEVPATTPLGMPAVPEESVDRLYAHQYSLFRLEILIKRALHRKKATCCSLADALRKSRSWLAEFDAEEALNGSGEDR